MKTLIKFAALLVFLFFAQKILACSCYPLPPIYEAFEGADAVFVGKVVSSNEDSIPPHGVDTVFTFEMVEGFKGVQGKQVILNRGRRDSSCYNGYGVGEIYLIYAYSEPSGPFHKYKGSDQLYQSSFCNRSTDIRSAQGQIHFIRQLLGKKPEDQIYGSVARSDTDPESHKQRLTYLEKMKVVLEGKNGRNFETETDAKGLFKFNNIPEGEYLLNPALPPSYRSGWPGTATVRVLQDKTIESNEAWLKERYGAYYIDFTVGWNNSFEGKVLDRNGVALDRYVIALLPAALANQEMTPDVRAKSPDSHGPERKYHLNGHTPGKYVLAVEVYAPFGSYLKKRYFYPQADTLSKAQIIEVTPTTKLENMEFKIPLTLGEIRGEASWSDGTPIKERVWINLRALETGDENLNTDFDWDGADNGKFNFQAVEGLEYWVHLSVTVEVRENGKEIDKELNARPVKVKVDKNNKVLKIIFEKPPSLVIK